LNVPQQQIGVVRANDPRLNPLAPIQVISTQTLVRRPLEIDECDLIIIDEAHIWFQRFEELFAHRKLTKVLIIGLSATPWTSGLGNFYEQLIVAATTKELIAEGALCPVEHWAPSEPIDLSKVRIGQQQWRGRDGIRDREYNQADLEKVMSAPKIVADVVDTWMRRAQGRQTVCFTVNRAHASKIVNAFRLKGVRVGYVDFLTDLDERRETEKNLMAGETDVLVNVGVYALGADMPSIGCVILATATASQMRYVQMVGRGLRVAAGKQNLIVLDHGDHCRRLGFAEDIHYRYLHDGQTPLRQDPPEPVAHICENCGYTYRRAFTLNPCPQCDFLLRKSDEISRQGELIRLAPSTPEEQRIAVYQDLLGMGWKKGRLGHYFRRIFGFYPHKDRDIDYEQLTPSALPSFFTTQWLKRLREDDRREDARYGQGAQPCQRESQHDPRIEVSDETAIAGFGT
jgi:DNA repair protein RadD